MLLYYTHFLMTDETNFVLNLFYMILRQFSGKDRERKDKLKNIVQKE